MHLPHLHVFHLVDLFMNTFPAFLTSRGLLDVQVVAIDRRATIKHRWLPQDHHRGVTDLQYMKTNRNTLKIKVFK